MTITPLEAAPAAAQPLSERSEFALTCHWQSQAGHPHLAVGYVITGGETVWGVYICSATYLTPGNEWSFTLPLSFDIQNVTAIALNALAWDRYMVIESERRSLDEAGKRAVATSLQTIVQYSRPSKLVAAITEFLGA